MLDKRQTTSEEILYVFIERTCTIGVQNNYVLDEMFEEALEEARNCDETRRKDNWEKVCWRPDTKLKKE